MIDRFSREQFEAALPGGLWTGMGCINGEFLYVVQVRDYVLILIRSSVQSDGYAANVGENSIRCWLVDENYKPLVANTQAYVTRAPGWEVRMIEVLRTLWRKGRTLQTCCNRPMGEFKVRKDAAYKSGPYGSLIPSQNRGRSFRKCRVCGRFEWIQ